MELKNVLITGGAGFIGSRLALKLISKGYKVTIVDSLLAQIHGANPETDSATYSLIRDKVNFIHGSVVSRDIMGEAIKGQDAIIHLAAETGTGQSMYEIDRYTGVNIGGTSLLLDLLVNNKHSVKKIVVASSRAIYGEGKYKSEELGIVYPTHRNETDLLAGNFEVTYPNARLPLKLMPTDEASRIHPSSLYGITKQVQEQLIMTVSPTIGILPVAFRYQNVYGPGQSLKNPYTGILSIFSNLIRGGKGINIFEDGLESRDFVYIDDVVTATVLGLESNRANGEVFNVGTGEATDVLTIAKYLMKLYDLDVPLNISGNFRIGDIRHNYADISKIKELLGFKIEWSLENGLKMLTDWVKESALEDDNSYDISLKELKVKGLLK